MNELIDEQTTEQVKRLLATLAQPVTFVYFTQPTPCNACRQQREILETVAELSERVTLEIHDLVEDAVLASRYGVSRVPATAVVGAHDYGIRFYGVTLGFEFSSLLQAVVLVSRGSSGLEPELETLVRLIDVPVHLEVMVTLTCPYCPKMVHVAHQLAIANPQIRADMVEATEFPQLVQRYRVHGVPRTIINESAAFEGALPAAQVVLEVLKAIKPDEYERIDQALRELHGGRKVSPVSLQHRYQVIIVGAGPAALTAAIYAARKGMDAALLGDHVGGQVTNTATVENWPGTPSIEGQELAHLFRNHAERYPIAEQLKVKVKSIERDGEDFLLTVDDHGHYRTRAVVYCTGKEYRHLGVPGESRFIGHGVAFCATCDAPLYHNKRVAVIGGGNSAFTAARDLLGFAREIHIVNITDKSAADRRLQEEVLTSPKVTLHRSMQVKAFLGDKELTGIRLAAVDGSERSDLAIEGVFLEIGLVPNTGPVRGLLSLNGNGEIPVNPDQSTELPGFFAAGDVTDESEKQIVVAAGAGAKAALAAYRYINGG